MSGNKMSKKTNLANGKTTSEQIENQLNTNMAKQYRTI